MAVTRQHSDLIAKSLRDFGYDVPDEYVWEQVQLLRSRRKAAEYCRDYEEELPQDKATK